MTTQFVKTISVKTVFVKTVAFRAVRVDTEKTPDPIG